MTQLLEPSLFGEYRASIAECFREAVLPVTTLPEEIIAYYLGLTDRDGTLLELAPDKLVRPSLCLWATSACGGDAESVVPIAVGIELLHSSTLIHDEIRVGSRFRGDRVTAWTEWGLAQSLNAGDALYSLAFRLFGLRAEEPARMLRIITLATAGALEVVDGPGRDASRDGRSDATLREYLPVAFGRMGSLLGVSLQIGAIVAGASDRIALRLRHAGRLLGVALHLRHGNGLGEGALDSRTSVRDLLIAARGERAIQALADRYGERACAVVAGCDGIAKPSLEIFEEMVRYLANRTN